MIYTSKCRRKICIYDVCLRSLLDRVPAVVEKAAEVGHAGPPRQEAVLRLR